MNKRFDLILFDMDGTIADTDEMIVESFFTLYDMYLDGKRKTKEEIYYFSGPPIKETLKKEFPHLDVDFMYKEYLKVSQKIYDTTVYPMKGCREVLIKLKEAGIKLGVVTNKMRKPALKTLDIIGFNDLFTYIVGFDDVKNGKPSNEGILKALNFYQIKNLDKVLYVGDNMIDDLTAKNAGIKSAIIYFGKREIPKTLKPDIKLFNFNDLLKEAIYE